jgi:hypothetical protein
MSSKILQLTIESLGLSQTEKEKYCCHNYFHSKLQLFSPRTKVSLLGVVAIWGDCTFIPADWGT